MFNIVIKSQLLHVQNLKVRKFYKSFGVPIKMIFFTPLFIIIPSPFFCPEYIIWWWSMEQYGAKIVVKATCAILWFDIKGLLEIWHQRCLYYKYILLTDSKNWLWDAIASTKFMLYLNFQFTRCIYMGHSPEVEVGQKIFWHFFHEYGQVVLKRPPYIPFRLLGLSKMTSLGKLKFYIFGSKSFIFWTFLKIQLIKIKNRLRLTIDWDWQFTEIDNWLRLTIH